MAGELDAFLGRQRDGGVTEPRQSLRYHVYHASPIARLWPCSSLELRTLRTETGSTFSTVAIVQPRLPFRCAISLELTHSR